MARLKGAMDAIGLDGSKLDIVLMQFVRLMQDGQPVKMSKRTGKAISLTDLIDEVPVDAARFLFNLREPNSMVDFDLGLAVEQSMQNPVYYVQYAHARICSLLKKLAEEGVSPRACSQKELSALNTSEEAELIRALARFPQEIVDAARSYDPARLTKYAVDVATLFHKYYTVCRVKGEAEPAHAGAPQPLPRGADSYTQRIKFVENHLPRKHVGGTERWKTTAEVDYACRCCSTARRAPSS